MGAASEQFRPDFACRRQLLLQGTIEYITCEQGYTGCGKTVYPI